MEKEGPAHRDIPARWLRGEATLEDGWIVLDPGRSSEYGLYEETDVPYELTRVQRPPDALPFVRRFGLLWHGPDAADHRERFEDWKTAAGDLAALCTMHIRLREALAGDRAALEWLGQLAPTIGNIFPAADIATEEALLAYTSKALAFGVNRGLEGVEQLVFAEVDWRAGRTGEFVMSAHAPHLLGYAYHRLALDIVGRVPLAICLECGRVYEQLDPRRRFCESACANRARYRRWASKKEDMRNG